MNLSKIIKLFKNSYYIFFGSIGSKVITFLMLPLYTKWLNPSDYGISDLISTYAFIFVPLISFCISEAIFVYPKNRIKKIQSSFFTTGFTFVATIFLIVFLLIYFLKDYVAYDNIIFDYIWFIYLISLFSFLSTFLQQFSRAIDMIKVYASAGIVQVITVTILSFTLIPKYGLIGMLYGQIISIVVVCLFLIFKTKAFTFFNIKLFSKKRLSIILRYSIPLVPNSLMFILIAYTNRPIIENYLGVDSLGILAIAEKFSGILLMFVSIFMYAWQISAIEEYKNKGYEKFYNIVLRSGFMIILLVSLIISFFSFYLIKHTINEEFLSSWKYIPVLLFSPPLVYISSIVGVNFLVTKQTKYFFKSTVIGGIGAVVFNIILIPNYGLFGACVSIGFSQFLIMISRIYYSRKIVIIANQYKYIYSYFLLIFISFRVINFEYDIINICYFILCILILLYINRDIFLSIKKNLKIHV